MKERIVNAQQLKAVIRKADGIYIAARISDNRTRWVEITKREAREIAAEVAAYKEMPWAILDQQKMTNTGENYTRIFIGG